MSWHNKIRPDCIQVPGGICAPEQRVYRPVPRMINHVTYSDCGMVALVIGSCGLDLHVRQDVVTQRHRAHTALQDEVAQNLQVPAMSVVVYHIDTTPSPGIPKNKPQRVAELKGAGAGAGEGGGRQTDTFHLPCRTNRTGYVLSNVANRFCQCTLSTSPSCSVPTHTVMN